MGYEVTLVVGEVGYLGGELPWLNVIATFDLNKPGSDSVVAKLPREGVKVYFFGLTDGNTEVRKDKYGDPCVALPLDVVLKALKQDAKREPDYRRWKPAIALLQATRTAWKGRSLHVVLYGH